MINEDLHRARQDMKRIVAQIEAEQRQKDQIKVRVVSIVIACARP